MLLRADRLWQLCQCALRVYRGVWVCAPVWDTHLASLPVKSAKRNSSVHSYRNGTERPWGLSVHLLIWMARKEEFLGLGVHLREQHS